MDEIKSTVGSRLINLRKSKKLTQLELAEKFNYSDKSVSKWERGDAIPSIDILLELAKFYNVSLDYLVGEENIEPQKIEHREKTQANKVVITILSVMVAWIVATLLYVFLKILFNINYWLAFIWAVPVSFLLLIIFNAIWAKKKYSILFTSGFMWTLLTGLFLQLIKFKAWQIFLIGAPLQIAIILWSQLKKSSKPKDIF